MKKIIIVISTVLLISCASSNKINQPTQASRVVSSIDDSAGNELVLIQKFSINASIEEVWNAYTTQQGWQAWAVPMAEVNWKVGGLIRTNYNTKGKIGDATTIVNHIVNYVPNKLITLQAELSPHFPKFMQDDAKDFYNVIYFNAIDAQHTQVESYGIGYKNTEKYQELMKFFIPANKQSYQHLINYLEQGIKQEFK